MIVVARVGVSDEAAVHYEALSAFAERAALAIQNARLYERLQEQVDELRAMHEQIVRTERLAAIGEIAAKVAHELNNPLTSIHLYNSMLLEEPVEGAEQQRLAASVMEQVERAKRVVHDILDFSRPQESHPEIASLNGTVEYGLRLIQHVAQASGVAVVEDYAGGLPDVLVDSGQMAQIFTNLATNAIQAMSQGGKLLVRTGMQGEELYVSFTDTGTGISPADRDRIFEPFFTTKAAGEGTGLGLPVVKGLVSRHHGRVTVDSEPGRGSTFTVWLPPSMETKKEGMVA
jgi:signal transduction histidine kinase